MFDTAPLWFQLGLHEIGTREEPGNKGPAIARYISLARCGQQGDPWCAIFANAMLELAHIRGTRSASSQSFAHDEHFIQLHQPCLGAVTVFWRGVRSHGLGHVGFYRGEIGNSIYVLEGNAHDMVQIGAHPAKADTFGLVGYFWPRDVAVPKLGPIIMPAGTPVVREPGKVT